MKKILYLLIFAIFSSSITFAHPCAHKQIPQKQTFKEKKKIDKIYETRLKLTNEQIEVLKQIRIKHRKEMEKIISRMEFLHNKIRNVYLSGIPPYQADFRTMHYKAELVLLKQNADKLKQGTRKKFEAILTPEQKQEFEKMLKEKHSKGAN